MLDWFWSRIAQGTLVLLSDPNWHNLSLVSNLFLKKLSKQRVILGLWPVNHKIEWNSNDMFLTVFQAELKTKFPDEEAIQFHYPVSTSWVMLFAASVLRLASNFHVPKARGEIGASHTDVPLQYLSFIHLANKNLDVQSFQMSFKPAAALISVSFLKPTPPSFLGLHSSVQLIACILPFHKEFANCFSNSLHVDAGNLKLCIQYDTVV